MLIAERLWFDATAPHLWQVLQAVEPIRAAHRRLRTLVAKKKMEAHQHHYDDRKRDIDLN